MDYEELRITQKALDIHTGISRLLLGITEITGLPEDYLSETFINDALRKCNGSGKKSSVKDMLMYSFIEGNIDTLIEGDYYPGKGNPDRLYISKEGLIEAWELLNADYKNICFVPYLSEMFDDGMFEPNLLDVLWGKIIEATSSGLFSQNFIESRKKQILGSMEVNIEELIHQGDDDDAAEDCRGYILGYLFENFTD